MDNESLILPTSTSTLSLAIHPLPILNISEHWTRERLQAGSSNPIVLGVLLGTQNGREVEIVNSFELGVEKPGTNDINHAFLVSRRDQYKEVFPSLDFIGWYTVSQQPTKAHVALNEQFTAYSSTPLMLLLQPSFQSTGQNLPLRAFEPTMEIRERRSRTYFINVPYTVETGEAERIAVDFTGRGGEQGSTLSSHLSTQRSAVQMLHDRIQILIGYLTAVTDGKAPKDHQTLRALASLVASVPASENSAFRDEFDNEFTDVQLTAYLSALTTSTNTLSELVDKHIVHTASKTEDRGMIPRRRGMMGMMGMRSGHEMLDRYGM